MSTGLDIALVAGTALTALAGGYLGARLGMRGARTAELRALLDEASSALARAEQTRGRAYERFVIEGTNTSEAGVEAVSAFRYELSLAEQTRDRLRFRTAPGAAVYEHLAGALEALGRISIALGTAARLPADWQKGDELNRLHATVKDGEAEFQRERTAFLAAARAALGE